MMRFTLIRAWCCTLLAAFAVWLLFAVLDVGGQRTLFFSEGSDLLSDFWMPKTCLLEGYRQVGDDFPVVAGIAQSGWIDGQMRVRSVDRCYPATALMPLKLFPATWSGALMWTVLVTISFMAAMCIIAGGWWPLVLFGTMPVLFNVERGNLVGLSAAAVAMFLAWYRSDRPWQRMAAALALSIATCLKISPVLLGLLYLPQRDWKAIAWCIVFCAVLFLVPWCFVPSGFSALPAFVSNASENAVEYARTSEYGLVAFWRAVRVLFGQDCMHTWTGCISAMRVSQAVGLATVAFGVWRRCELMVVVGMLWAAGNMHYYGALYLVPLFVIMLANPSSCRLSLWRKCVYAACWFAILCPMQLVVSGHSANAILCNASAAVLAILHGCGGVSDDVPHD